MAVYLACNKGGGNCQAERAKAKEAQDTYFNQTYLNPKEAQAGYKQIENLLESTDPNAKEVFNILDGYIQAFMTFGYTEEEARARAGTYVGSIYVLGGMSAVLSSNSLTKQFGKDVAADAKPSGNTTPKIDANKGTTGQIAKNSDGIHEVTVNKTPLEAHDRLNTPDLGGSGKLKPAEAASAAQLESSLGKMERYVPPKGATSGTSPDFVITSGPNKGKTVDAMYTTDKLSQKEIDGLNKFYEKNMSTGSGKDVIQDHLKKADFVPVDFRVLTSTNQKIFIDYVKTLPRSQQDKIIIVR